MSANILLLIFTGEKKRLSRVKANPPKDTSHEVAEVVEPVTSISSTTNYSTTIPNDVEIESLPYSTTCPASEGVPQLDFSSSSWNPLDDPAFESMLPSPGALPDFLIADESSSEDSLNQMSVTLMGPSLGEAFSTINPSKLDNTSMTSSDGSFPDSYLLPVHELTLLKAMFRIADRIGCKGQLWSLDAPSPFFTGIATPSHLLPVSLRPTRAQTMIPHHPLLDVLPWPGVRERVIQMFTLPDEMRPSGAAGPLALVNFAYDVEDNSEGVRIYGEDPYDPASWEVGQVLFERWWFLFDRSIIETSNRWRRLRGAPQLRIKSSDNPSPSTVTSLSSG